MEMAEHDPMAALGPARRPVPRAPRSPRIDEREEEMPRRLFGIARDALLNGWMVQLDHTANGGGWRIIIRDERHCMHMSFLPSQANRVSRHGPWSYTRNGLWGTCVAQEEKLEVRAGEIGRWLADHPDQCTGNDYAEKLALLHSCHCSASKG